MVQRSKWGRNGGRRRQLRNHLGVDLAGLGFGGEEERRGEMRKEERSRRKRGN